MTMIRYTILFLLFTLIYPSEIISQDIHYSQFYNSPQNLNPAQTGIFNGDHRFIGSHRGQWRYVPVPWTTFSGSYDTNFTPYNKEKVFYGLGLNFNYDRQGDSRLNLLNLSLSGAIHGKLNANNIISFGGTLGFANRGFDTKDLIWDKQWDANTFSFNTGAATGENFANAQSVSFLESALGLNYRYQKSSRTYLDLGVGAMHIIEPEVAFKGEKSSKLPRRFSFSGVGNFQLTEKVDLQLHALHQIQSKYNETIVGGLGKFHVNQDRGKELQLHLGLGYRTSGSWIPTAALQWTNWYLGFNLDFDRTNFNQTFSTSRGAYELHLRYIIKNVKPFKFKNCPIL